MILNAYLSEKELENKTKAFYKVQMAHFSPIVSVL